MRRENKKLEPLPTVIERYADVFRAAGLAYTESFTSLYESRPADLSKMEAIAGVKTGKWLGVAPFARYQGKVYPIDEMEQVVATLSKREDLTLFLFGAKGYEEAAYIDGCGYLKTMVQIMIPMAKPSILTVILFQFLSFWNEYIIAFTIMDDNSTLAVGLKNLMAVERTATNYGIMYAGLVIVMIPVLILYVCVQKQLTKGMTLGGLKG